MKKNGFLTFCFAFIPGAGQMYQGYMKRGLSLVGICCLAIAVGSLLPPLGNAALAVCCVVWMYSFFDTFNLRAQLGAGMAPADDYLVHLGQDVSLDRLLHRRHKLFGWVLDTAVPGLVMVRLAFAPSGPAQLARWFLLLLLEAACAGGIMEFLRPCIRPAEGLPLLAFGFLPAPAFCCGFCGCRAGRPGRRGLPTARSR